MKVFNNISSRLVILAALAIGAFSSAAAQEQNPEKVSANPISIAPGEEVEVVVNYESSVKRPGYNMDIYLPEGLSFVEVEDGAYIKTGESTDASFTKGESIKETEDGLRVRLIVYNMVDKEAMLSDGVLLTFKVKADEKLAETSEIKFRNVKFSGGKYLDEFTCTVTKSQATGISEAVVAGSESEIIYNMAGQRVSGKAKGIVIKNGKKVINK